MKRKIESLHGLVDVDRAEQPPAMVFVMVHGETVVIDGVPTVAIEVEGFARLKVLSRDLQKAVREEVEAGADKEATIAAMHPDTRTELWAANTVKP